MFPFSGVSLGHSIEVLVLLVLSSKPRDFMRIRAVFHFQEIACHNFFVTETCDGWSRWCKTFVYFL